jgi:hypothetical protein
VVETGEIIGVEGGSRRGGECGIHGHRAGCVEILSPWRRGGACAHMDIRRRVKVETRGHVLLKTGCAVKEAIHSLVLRTVDRRGPEATKGGTRAGVNEPVALERIVSLSVLLELGERVAR